MTRRAVLVAAALSAAAVGCGDGRPRTVPVSGRVTLQSRPLAGGTVTFVPIESGPAATGPITADGRFTLTTFRPGDGAVPGRYAVAVIAVADTSTLLPDEALPPAPLLVPRRYTSHRTSPLTVDVADSPNVINIQLEP
jgi:hypothetical protein